MDRSDEERGGIPDLPEHLTEMPQTSVHAQPIAPAPASEEGEGTTEEQAMEEDRRSREHSREEGAATEKRRDEH